MTERKLKFAIGIALIGMHVGVMLLVIAFYVHGGFSFDQLTTVLAVIAPMFAGYTTAITVFIVNNRYQTRDVSKSVTATFALMSLMFPVLFTVLIVGAISLQAFTLIFANFEEFKQALVVIEAVFAGYVGRFVYAMFAVPKGQERRSSNAMEGQDPETEPS